jgi:hypothetical protein
MPFLIVVQAAGGVFQATAYISGIPIFRAENCISPQVAISAVQSEDFKWNKTKRLWRVWRPKAASGQRLSNAVRASPPLLCLALSVTKDDTA